MLIHLSPLAFTFVEIRQAFTLLKGDALCYAYCRLTSGGTDFMLPSIAPTQLYIGFTSGNSATMLDSTA